MSTCAGAVVKKLRKHQMMVCFSYLGTNIAMLCIDSLGVVTSLRPRLTRVRSAGKTTSVHHRRRSWSTPLHPSHEGERIR